MESPAPSWASPLRNLQADDLSSSPDRCPFLGSTGAAGTTSDFPSGDNRCKSTYFPVPVSTIHQENYCLSSGFEACPVFRERSKNRPGGKSLLPLTQVRVANDSVPEPVPVIVPDWAQPPTNPIGNETRAIDWNKLETDPSGQSEPLRFHWEEQTAHPDFQADIELASARRHQSPRRNWRPLLYGLLLLALIPLLWWLWTNVRPGAQNGIEAVEGRVIALPSLTPSPAFDASTNGNDSNGVGVPAIGGAADEDGAAITQTDAAAAPVALTTPTDLEIIAATATALFVDATVAPVCAAPSWWVSYAIEEGDSVELLAAARGILAEELIAANCLAGPDLVPGNLLLLPPVGVIIAPTDTPTATPTTLPTRITRQAEVPTRITIFLPTATTPAITVTSPPPTAVPDEDVATVPAVRPSTTPAVAPTTSAGPTATAPNPVPTITPPSPVETETASP